jgi:hypothetical protein
VGEFCGFDHQRNRVVVYGGLDASVGVTSIPEYVPLGFSVVHLEGSWVLILVFSIARYTVSSLLLPFQPTTTSGSGRTIRVQETKTMFHGLVDALGAARGVRYERQDQDLAEAGLREEQARIAGDEEAEMMWSIRPLIASGFGVADGEGKGLDSGLFGFTPETAEETFQRMYK